MDELTIKKKKMAVIIITIIAILVSLLLLLTDNKENTINELPSDTSLSSNSNTTDAPKSTNNSSNNSSNNDSKSTKKPKKGDTIENGSNYIAVADGKGGCSIKVTGEDVIEKQDIPYEMTTFHNNAFGFIYDYPKDAKISNDTASSTSFSIDNMGITVCLTNEITSINSVSSNASDIIKNINFEYNSEVYNNAYITDTWKGFLATKSADETRARDQFKIHIRNKSSKKGMDMNVAAYYVYYKEQHMVITIFAYETDNNQDMINYMAYLVGNSISLKSNMQDIKYSDFAPNDKTDYILKYPSDWKIEELSDNATSFKANNSSNTSLAGCQLFYISDKEKKYVSNTGEFLNHADELIQKKLANSDLTLDESYYFDKTVTDTQIKKMFGHDGIIMDISYKYIPMTIKGASNEPELGTDIKIKLFCFNKNGEYTIVAGAYNNNIQSDFLKLAKIVFHNIY